MTTFGYSEAIPTHRLTDAQRIDEAARILARGVVRWHRSRRQDVRQESSPDWPKDSDFPLDFLPTKSVHHDGYHSPENSA